MTEASNNPLLSSYQSFTQSPMESELTLTYSSSDSSPNNSPVASHSSSPLQTVSIVHGGDSSTNLLEHLYIPRLDTSAAARDDNDNITDNNLHQGDSINNYCKVNNMASLISITLNKMLYKKSLADALQHPVLSLLSQNGRYALPVFLALYLIVLLVVWLPLALLSKLITEMGVYTFLILSIFYIGRCILRLLAFPGTNVKVYGEIELEFAKYSCKLVAETLEGFARAICAAGTKNGGEGKKTAQLLGDEDVGWSVMDIPAMYKRVGLYRDRVLGVYWEVLHCLLKEGGKGYDPNDERRTTQSGSFYGRNAVQACKRNLCCGGASDLSVSCDGAMHDGSDRLSKRAIGNKTKYGNNPLVGDVGNMMNLTTEARSDGKELYVLLTSILEDLELLIESSSNILRIIDNKTQLKGAVASEEAVTHAKALITHSMELRQLVKRIKPPSSSSSTSPSSSIHANEDIRDEESEVGADAVRHRLEENGTVSSSTTVGMIQSAIHTFWVGHNSRLFLARYRGAKQFWVDRGGGGTVFGGNGRIDVILIPSQSLDCCDTTILENCLPMSPRQGRDGGVVSLSSSGGGKGRKAVLYCNPNAGLAEVATGLGLIGGNVDQDKDDGNTDATCWTDFYAAHGFDVYLFNYRGYGRSHGGRDQVSEFQPGFVGRIRRLFYAAFLSFKPTSQSLKLDAIAVAKHILDHEDVEQLVIHGESIGGMAAAGAARVCSGMSFSKTASTRGAVSLLICDRTFCNLEAVAQRLVGAWTGNAIRLLTLNSWNTDVVGDFLAAKCPKVVANDAADEIIHDYSSLKSGLSFARELTRGMSHRIGWMMSAPMEYLMADFENISVTDSSALTFQAFQVSPPSWPADKRVTWKEAFHFAACVKRIGKLATATKREMPTPSVNDTHDEQESIEVSCNDDCIGNTSLRSEANSSHNSELIDIWNTLACCDGLCGSPLGHAAKEGFDCTMSWLCCAVVMGGQAVAKAAERRIRNSKRSTSAVEENNLIEAQDFDFRPLNYEHDESDTMKHPIPLPVVLSYLKTCRRSRLHDVEAELSYVIGMLEYVVQRILSTDTRTASIAWRNSCDDDQSTRPTGYFLNLHCGHNNQYSSKERDELMSLIHMACGEHWITPHIGQSQ
eukprot:CCRYP_015867-RA/>CCRYP_015867-RA protein AED:0.16 eAED:0.18 QI:0/0/0.2/1/0.5/0.2/5/343/1127